MKINLDTRLTLMFLAGFTGAVEQICLAPWVEPNQWLMAFCGTMMTASTVGGAVRGSRVENGDDSRDPDPKPKTRRKAPAKRKGGNA